MTSSFLKRRSKHIKGSKESLFMCSDELLFRRSTPFHVSKLFSSTTKQLPRRDHSSVCRCTTGPPTVYAKSSNGSLLQSRAELAAIFSQPPPIAYKRVTNIRDMLVRSKLCQPATRISGTTPCNQAKCGTCPFICRHQHQRYWH